MVFVFLCLTYFFSMMISRSIHVAANGIISFIFMAIYICIHLLFPFICWWTIGLFPGLDFVNSAGINIGVHVSLNYSFVWWYAQEWICWIIWQLKFLVFWGTSILFSIVAAPVYIPTNSVGEFPFLHTLSSIGYL